MVATRTPQTPADLAPTEFVEFCIAEVLASLGTTESAAERLEPALAFDVGCALQGARQALDRALAIISSAQQQPQIHRLAA
jgi:uncharacterized metal-binding protein